MNLFLTSFINAISRLLGVCSRVNCEDFESYLFSGLTSTEGNCTIKNMILKA